MKKKKIYIEKLSLFEKFEEYRDKALLLPYKLLKANAEEMSKMI